MINYVMISRYDKRQLLALDNTNKDINDKKKKRNNFLRGSRIFQKHRFPLVELLFDFFKLSPSFLAGMGHDIKSESIVVILINFFNTLFQQ